MIVVNRLLAMFGYKMVIRSTSRPSIPVSATESIQTNITPLDVKETQTNIALEVKETQTEKKEKKKQQKLVDPKDVDLNDDNETFEDFEDMKMLLVVRTDLGMQKGKMCAQCAHAAVDLYKKVTKRFYFKLNDKTSPEEAKTTKKWFKWLSAWEQDGYAKVALKVDTEAELFKVEEAAKAAGIPTSIICDAGRTQIAAGSYTVVGLGPCPGALLEPFAGKKILKLL